MESEEGVQKRSSQKIEFSQRGNRQVSSSVNCLKSAPYDGRTSSSPSFFPLVSRLCEDERRGVVESGSVYVCRCLDGWRMNYGCGKAADCSTNHSTLSQIIVSLLQRVDDYCPSDRWSHSLDPHIFLPLSFYQTCYTLSN